MSERELVLAVNFPISPELSRAIADVSPRLRVLTRAELKVRPERLSEAEILWTHHIDPERIAAAAGLRWVQTTGAGVEWLLKPAVCARADLIVSNARGMHAQTIAEHVFGFILILGHRLHDSLLQQQRAQWDSAPMRDRVLTLDGQTLGILGVGAIGRRTAQLGASFGMQVIGLRNRPRPEPGFLRIDGPDQLPALLGQARYIVNALPLTAATHKLIGREQFAQMRPDAVFINIGRGGTVDTDALVEALRSGRIAAAALDVTDPEPLPAEHPLWSLPEVIITPHYAGAQPDYLGAASRIFLDNLKRYLSDQPLNNVVDKHAGY